MDRDEYEKYMDATYIEGQMVLPFEGTMPCSVCGGPDKWDNDEPCYSCMNPAMPDPVWYHDGPGDEPGWQDSRFPNEY